MSDDSISVRVCFAVLHEITHLSVRRGARNSQPGDVPAPELASIDLFRFEATLWNHPPGLGRPVILRGRRNTRRGLNYVCQILNLFEMAIRLRKEVSFSPEVFGSWVIWYLVLRTFRRNLTRCSMTTPSSSGRL